MKALYLAGAFALLASSAFAGTMDSTFGNTTVVTNTKTNAVTTMFFEANNTYTAKGKNAEGTDVELAGTWKVEGDKVCTTPNAMEGQPAPVTTCADYVDGKNPGDTWEIMDSNGDKLSVTINAGR
ncbi:MAG: hypothetical protein HXY22_11060 [Alphaproteobacteria bacterium]|nr:hypothetical protein [Alphaproteobacteria bacterium]